MLTKKKKTIKVTLHQAMPDNLKTFPTLIAVGPSPANETVAMIRVQWQKLACSSVLTWIRIARVNFWK